MSSPETPGRLRREPPRFRRVEVLRTERVSPRMMRVTVGGAELDGFTVEQPASSVRVLLPTTRAGDFVVPTWTGNEYRLPNGERPRIRTLTPRRVDTTTNEIDLDIVLHGEGTASRWAEHATVGSPSAISGPARGYAVPSDGARFVLGGDETALPALTQVLRALPQSATVTAFIEIATPDAAIHVEPREGATVAWLVTAPAATPGHAFATAVCDAVIDDDTFVWAAGEAAAVQRIRRYLFEHRGMPRGSATIRGYWKHGRTADSGDES
jgi:NADPH-dependent ferric siderophore reductase